MAGWSDYDVDWTSPDTIRLTPYSEVMLALNVALKERSFNSTPSIEILNDLFNIYKVSAYAMALQYVNHTAETLVAPTRTNWNQASLETALGASIITAPIRPNEITAEWLYQQYEIINLMRWRSLNAYGMSLGVANLGHLTYGPIGDISISWSHSYSLLGLRAHPDYQEFSSWRTEKKIANPDGTPLYYVYAFLRGAYAGTPEDPEVNPNSNINIRTDTIWGALDYDLDFTRETYFYPVKPRVSNPHPPYIGPKYYEGTDVEFWDGGIGLVEDNYSLFDVNTGTLLANAGNQTFTTENWNGITDYPPLPGSSPTVHHWKTIKGFELGNAFIGTGWTVLKCDGANGFRFKDW